MNKQFKIGILFFFLFTFSQAYAQVPSIQWWYDVKDASFGQSVAADIDGDGYLEVVFGCYRNDSSIYALNAENGTLLWKYNAHGNNAEGCNDVAPTIFDVDGDGLLEVIVPSSCNPKTFCFEGASGNVKWACNTKGSDSPPTIADIDNDGKPEILHGEFGGFVKCINAENGTPAWEIAVNTDSWVQTAPTIVDLNGDNQLDFVVATWHFNKKDSIYAYRGDNQTLLWTFPVYDHIYHGTAIADLDHDGKPELVIGSYNDTLYCLNGEDGSVNWKFKASGGYIGGPAVIADIDNDGSCEVVFASAHILYALSNTGVLKWQFNVPNYGQCFRGVAVADINNDNYLDVIFGTSKGELYTLNGNNGSLIWSLDLAAHYGNSEFELEHAPLVSDFDHDGTMDIFIVGGHGEYPNFQNDYGRAYMISAGIGKGPDWRMFQHDIRRQSSMCAYTSSGINDIEESNYFTITPIPFSTQATIQTKKYLTDATLTVTNLFGQKVKVLEHLNGQTILVNREGLAHGIYFIQLQDKGTQFEPKKIIIED